METAIFSPLLLIPLLPLLGAATLTFFGYRMSRMAVHMVALGACFGAFAISATSAFVFVKGGQVPLEYELWTWMAVGRYSFPLNLGMDQLSATMILVVTGVGFLIHVFSAEYMGHDPAYARYFAYLNFFIFAMSTLVLGRSMPVMFIGWEGVGLASYLLIGFWYTDPEKASAGKKAFITNRVGDFGFLLGLFTLVGLFGTADFDELRTAAEAVKDPATTVLGIGMFKGYTVQAVVTFACLALFLGATGKSAQIPLYVWLPDAMAGPTPVSALIHAATMVTAGVYMVCRLFFLFDMAPVAQDVVAWVGGLTALFAATIGLAQNDIKKVLAYSTVSQLGYMFLAAGLGGYGAAIFHVVTHAFFKACLFLGSGAVIHAMHEEQDMRRMGGLKKEIPAVFYTFGISTLALAGIAPLSGFFSKDGILAYAFQEKFPLWVLGFLAAGLTALYMARLVSLTFFGELRAKDEHGHHIHVHAPGPVMTWPLIVLALLAAVAGFANLPHPIGHLFGEHASLWFEHMLAPASASKALHLSAGLEWGLMAASVAWAATGLAVGYMIFKDGPSAKMEALTKAGAGKVAHALLYGKWFVDEIYQKVIIKPLQIFATILAVLVDPFVVDGVLVKVSGHAVRGAGAALTKIQTGNVQAYALVLVVSVAAAILWALK
jgi:NADH-quinone oxidoreductase subunit L